MKYFKLFIFIILIANANSCENKKESNELSFKLIKRNSYFTTALNGVTVYLLNETKKTMNGYYVVGNEFTKWEEFNVENGVLNGDYITFHSNGEMSSFNTYKKGKLEGKEKIFFLSGELKSLSNYSNGKKYGKSIDYFESGQVRKKTKLENEKPIESTTYDITGGIESQMFIEDGISITQTIKNGKVFSEELSSNYDDYEAMKFYNEDGTLKLHVRMVEENELPFIIELDENGNEIRKINVKKNPTEALKYMQKLMN